MKRIVLERTGLGTMSVLSTAFFAFSWGKGEIDFGLLLTSIAAYGTWFWSEFRQDDSATVLTSEASELSERSVIYSDNDLRVARKLTVLHAGDLRFFLKDHIFWMWVPSGDLTILRSLHNDWDRGLVFFQNPELEVMLKQFMEKLDALNVKLAEDLTPENIFGESKVGYKPFTYVSDSEYQRRLSESRAADALASEAWEELDKLVRHVKRHMPEAFSLPLEQQAQES